MSVLMSSDVGPRKHWLLQKWAGEEAAWNGNGDEAADAKTNQNGAEE
jgi:hypothetical protein